MNLTEATWTVLRTSGQASVLILIVLGVQRMLSSRIPAAWRYALWLPVVIRLVLPVAPESRFSIFNLLARKEPLPSQRYQVSVKTFSPRILEETLSDDTFRVLPQDRTSWRPSAMQSAGGVWLGFAVTLMMRWILTNWKFGKALTRCAIIRDDRICAVFDEARKDLGVTWKVGLAEHESIGSPALFGAIRPRLLLPPGIGQKFSDNELRHVFLHELAHVKRGDLFVNWLLVAVQALHWFNPLVWVACRRIRGDREFACDAIALRHLKGESPAMFGETMLKILQLFSSSSQAIGTISIVRGKAELKRRMQMISGFRTARRSSIVWAALLGVICVAGLSDAQSKGGQTAGPNRPQNNSTNLNPNAKEILAQDMGDGSAEEDLYSSVFKSSVGADSDSAGELVDPGWDWLQAKNPLLTISRITPLPRVPRRSYAYVNTELDLRNPSKVASDRTTLRHDAESDSVLVEDLRRRMLEEIPHQARVSAVSNLLETITIPEFSILVETPLSEVIQTLSNEVKEHDPKRRGINFLISSQMPARPGPNDPPLVEDFKVKVSPPLRNARVLDVLEAIKNGVVPRGELPSDRLLKYSIEDYAVLFTASADNALYSRTFKLNSETFLKAVRSRLHTADSIPPKSVQDEVRAFFAGVGLEFPKAEPASGLLTPNQPRKAIFFNERTGVLLVRATLNELDVVEEIAHRTQPDSPTFQVKLTMRVIETRPGSQRSAVEIVSDEIASFSNTPLEWKTNATENSATVISAIINDQNSKTLFKSLEKRGEYDLITTHEFTIPSGSETAVSIGGDVESGENKADVRLIPTVLGDNLVLSVGFQWTDSGHVDAQGNIFSVNAIAYVTRKVFAATRFSVGETVILSVPRTFRDGRDMLLFITPQNLGAEAVVKP